MVPVSSVMFCSCIKALGSPVTYKERRDAANPMDITPVFLSVLYCEEVKAKHRKLNSNKIPTFTLWRVYMLN